MSTPGTLFGIGVGPGDPDLITLKAVKTLGQVDVIFAASATDNDYSVALSIAQPHLRNAIPVETLDFPMTRDKEVLQAAWRENAAVVAKTLRDGSNAAFLTLGDPLIYSTFGYLLRTLQQLDPALPVQVIPGITSYQAAAAKTGTILSEAGQNLLVVSGVCDGETLRQDLSRVDNAVILKAYRKFPDIRQTLNDLGLADKATFVSRIGLPGEVIERNVNDVAEDPHYLSLLLVKKGTPVA
jgi:precorrin-2/cobalt-factor-2 C20-methyltransferase